MKLKEIPRTAVFAWSPDPHVPLIASGTVAGAVDADFSSNIELELWDLNLGNQSPSDFELKPIATAKSDARFHDLAWGYVTAEKPRGILVGAMENGNVDLWDPQAIKDGSGEAALIHQGQQHTGAVNAVDFNPVRHDLIASAGAKSELWCWDLTNPAKPFSPGQHKSTKLDDIQALAWNNQVSHILATGGSTGFTTVWDLKLKREVVALNYPGSSGSGRRGIASVAWHPENATKLITASEDDGNPVILIWDLRNSNAPERILSGHTAGVLSLSWCKKDPDLLLSCGKDNRSICWNPNSGEKLGELSASSQWTFETRWNQENPDLLATSSYDGKISIQSLQTVNNPQTEDTQVTVGGAAFFDQQNYADPSIPTLSLSRPQKWYRVPVGAKFGFGAKLVYFRPSSQRDANGRQTSEIKLTTIASDVNLSQDSKTFEDAVANEQLKDLCRTKLELATTDADKHDFQVLNTLFQEDPRIKLVEYLGFTVDELAPKSAAGELNEAINTKPVPNGSNDDDGRNFWDDGNKSFPEHLMDSTTKPALETSPFRLFPVGESQIDASITNALVLGRFDKAVEICLKEDKLADAFMLAICGGETSREKVQKAFFQKNIEKSPYLRLLSSIVDNDLRDVVENADLAQWKEVMAALCTFAKPAEFSNLCSALGDRLQLSDMMPTDKRKNATLCYLVGTRLDKVTDIWMSEFHDYEHTLKSQAPSQNTSPADIHARALQNFVEKTTIFRQAVKFQDENTKADGNWKLQSLYNAYTEYADIAASLGHMEVAQRYLKLLPTASTAAKVSLDRVRPSSKTAPFMKTSEIPTNQTLPSPRKNPMEHLQQGPVMSANQYGPAVTTHQYGPAAATPQYTQYNDSSQYGPPMTTSQYGGSTGMNPYDVSAATNPYGHTPGPNQYGPSVGGNPQSQLPGPNQYGQTAPSNHSNQSAPPNRPPSVPAPSQQHNPSGWNDLPNMPSLSRRQTPSGQYAPVLNPFNKQGPQPSSPQFPPVGLPGRQQQAPLPPPPTGAKAPQQVRALSPQNPATSPQSSIVSQIMPQEQLARPPSASTYSAPKNTYGAPLQQQLQPSYPQPPPSTQYTPLMTPQDNVSQQRTYPTQQSPNNATSRQSSSNAPPRAKSPAIPLKYRKLCCILC